MMLAKAVPNASRSAIVGWLGEALKVKLKAPPVDGKANAALIRFLAKRWRLPKSAIVIASGATARTKILSLQGDPDHLSSLVEADL